MLRSELHVLLGGIFMLAAGCAPKQGSILGLTADGKLTPCGPRPNCVSSDETGSHHIEPIKIGDDAAATWQALIAYLEADPSYEVQVREAGYLRAVACTRISRFKDDVEFHLRPEAGQIAMRSASRIGRSDLGKNRRRLEAVRRALSDELTASKRN